MIKLKDHIVHTSLQKVHGVELEKKLALFRSKEIAFVLSEHKEEGGPVKLLVLTSSGNLGWINLRDVDFI